MRLKRNDHNIHLFHEPDCSSWLRRCFNFRLMVSLLSPSLYRVPLTYTELSSEHAEIDGSKQFVQPRSDLSYLNADINTIAESTTAIIRSKLIYCN
ncbi:hypothetical protein PBCV1_a197R [Paramecium bursaria Chlorella virus 1]|uniref:Uncharacterized protein n=1 Tax=Paramecium bursaria Chlorella virus 1 TaxID=10506 RepID=Q84517_PBCV1|nr:hypothetical protein PBCV1_a197R [Paramecium bursaria Chlorella virus 1]AAC96565.1 hypothetical protein [Paramecium bursaria Chlorella virus 1]